MISLISSANFIEVGSSALYFETIVYVVFDMHFSLFSHEFLSFRSLFSR